jgi:hypothetical protein
MTMRPPPRPTPRLTPAVPSISTAHYYDPDRLNGGSAASPLIWLFVLAAAGADFVAFYIVLERLFRSLPLIVVIGTIGFTLAAIGLSHRIGVGLKQRRCGDRRAAELLWVSLACWLALGAAAFLVRLYLPPISVPTGGSTTFGAGGQAPATGPDFALLAALFFAALYLVSGVLTVGVAFATHNPAVAALERALKTRAVTAARRETSRAAEVELCGVQATLVTELDHAPQHRASMRHANQSVVSELKNFARLLMGVGRGPGELEDLTADNPNRRDTSRPADDESRPAEEDPS